MKEPTKTELLAKYATREPRAFDQYDASHMDLGEEHSPPDQIGIFPSTTYELFRGGWLVGVLIDQQAPPERAVLALRRIVEMIEQDIRAKQCSLRRELDLRGAEELAALAADAPAFAEFTADGSPLKVHLINSWLRTMSQAQIAAAIERGIAAGYPEYTDEVVAEWRKTHLKPPANGIITVVDGDGEEILGLHSRW